MEKQKPKISDIWISIKKPQLSIDVIEIKEISKEKVWYREVLSRNNKITDWMALTYLLQNYKLATPLQIIQWKNQQAS